MFTPLTNLALPDVLDILFLSVVGYHLYVWFRGTKAFRALIGLVVLAAIYSLARYWGLFLTTWVFQLLWQVLVILLLVLFQKEIRQALEKFDPLKAFSRRSGSAAKTTVGRISALARAAAERRWGALVVLKRRDAIPDLPDEGLALEAEISQELLLSIFNPTSPAHDGAVIVNGDKLERMGAVLPLSPRPDLPREYGTRHRAALGITEMCDAVAVIVSEETGHIGLAVEGRIEDLRAGERLETELAALMQPGGGEPESRLDLAKRLVTRNWKVKLGALVLVCLAWLAAAGQQDYQVTLKAPVTYVGLAKGLKVAGLSDREVKLSLIGPRRRAARLRPDEVKVVVDLKGRKPGDLRLSLIRQNIQIPLGLKVSGVNPRVLAVTLIKEERP